MQPNAGRKKITSLLFVDPVVPVLSQMSHALFGTGRFFFRIFAVTSALSSRIN